MIFRASDALNNNHAFLSLSDPAFSPDPRAHPDFVTSRQLSPPPLGHPVLGQKYARSATNEAVDLPPAPPNSPAPTGQLSQSLFPAAFHLDTVTEPVLDFSLALPMPDEPPAKLKKSFSLFSRSKPVQAPSKPRPAAKEPQQRPALRHHNDTAPVTTARPPTQPRRASLPVAPASSYPADRRRRNGDRPDGLGVAADPLRALRSVPLDGPYEAAAQAIRTPASTPFHGGLPQYYNHALQGGQPIYLPPQVPPGVSLNLSPGQILPRNFHIHYAQGIPYPRWDDAPAPTRAPPISADKAAAKDIPQPQPQPQQEPLPLPPPQHTLPTIEVTPVVVVETQVQPEQPVDLSFDIGLAMFMEPESPLPSPRAFTSLEVTKEEDEEDDQEPNPYRSPPSVDQSDLRIPPVIPQMVPEPPAYSPDPSPGPSPSVVYDQRQAPLPHTTQQMPALHTTSPASLPQRQLLPPHFFNGGPGDLPLTSARPMEHPPHKLPRADFTPDRVPMPASAPIPVAPQQPDMARYERAPSRSSLPSVERDARSTHHSVSTHSSSQYSRYSDRPPPRRPVPKHLVMPAPLSTAPANDRLNRMSVVGQGPVMPYPLPPQQQMQMQQQRPPQQMAYKVPPPPPASSRRTSHVPTVPSSLSTQATQPYHTRAQQIPMAPSVKLKKRLSIFGGSSPDPPTNPMPVTTVSFAPPVIDTTAALEKVLARAKTDRVPKRVLSKRKPF